MKIQSLYSRPEDNPKHRKNPDAVRPAPSPLGLAALGVGGGGSSSSSSSGLTVGTTTITSGTDTKVLFNNAGVLGEYTITGTGNVVMSASPTLTGTAAMASASLSGSLTFTELTLVRDAANTLAQRNGTNAQTFRVYNTYTDASNNEFGGLYWSGNFLWLQPLKTGSGSQRSLIIGNSTTAGSDTYLDASSAMYFRGSGGTERWRISTSGHFLAGIDNTYDIGASGATRPRNIYAATLITAQAGTIEGTYLQFSSNRGYMTAPSNGVWTFSNNAGTDFSRLQFGGTSSSFPALKRSSTSIAVRLADDSDDAPLTTLTVKTKALTVATLPAAATAGAGARAFVTDANATTFLSTVAGGGANNVPVVSDGTNWLIG